LKWSDINGEYLSVKRSLTQRLNGGLGVETTPKTASSVRILQIPLPLIKILEAQKERQQLQHNFTDDFRITNNIKNGSIDRRNKNYSSWAGVKTIRIHDFRHSHASVLANQKINIQEVSRRLGHSRIEMTWNTYCHLYPKEEEKAISILNNFVY
jgi:integrase